MKLTKWLRTIHVAAVALSSLLSLDRPLAAESNPDTRPMLRVPLTDAKPAVDGKLEELCWKQAARTGAFTVAGGKPAKSTTEPTVPHAAMSTERSS